MLVRQVEEGILQQLKSRQYAPGEKLPSLRELSREFGCSYVIAFRAVQSLKNSGYLETAKGNGIFVTGDARSRMEKKLIVYISDLKVFEGRRICQNGKKSYGSQSVPRHRQ